MRGPRLLRRSSDLPVSTLVPFDVEFNTETSTDGYSGITPQSLLVSVDKWTTGKGRSPSSDTVKGSLRWGQSTGLSSTSSGLSQDLGLGGVTRDLFRYWAGSTFPSLPGKVSVNPRLKNKKRRPSSQFPGRSRSLHHPCSHLQCPTQTYENTIESQTRALYRLFF